MLNAIVDASLRYKVLVLVAFAVVIGLGVQAFRNVPVDAFPDVTPIQVNVYGSKMPLNQLATISVPEPRTISVQVWDKSNVPAVDKAIREANLGINPIVDGTLIRLPIPSLTAERRQELAKLAHKYAEHARVAVRNVRREGMELLKKLEKDSKMSQDEHHKASAKVQELTDKLVKEIDDTLAAKESEIHKV